MMTQGVMLDELKARAPRLYVVATGAGAGLQSILWRVPGCSKFLVGASFPYDLTATKEFLGYEPFRAVHFKTAVGLAQEAFVRACRGTGDGPPMGLGITAAVTSDRERQGENRVKAAIVTMDGTWTLEQTMQKGPTDMMSRQIDGNFVDEAGIQLIAVALGLDFPIPRLRDRVVKQQDDVVKEILYEHPVFDGHNRWPWINPMWQLPGSFDPIHYGHRLMIHLSSRFFDSAYVLTADSLHKPSLTSSELLRRASQFRDERVPLVLTRNDPLFIQKARQFPNTTFIIGADTLQRMLEPQWFEKAGLSEFSPDFAGVRKMIDEFRLLGTKFLVFDRLVDGKFVTLNSVPYDYQDAIFQRKPHCFDISSSQIRAQRNKEHKGSGSAS